MPNPDPTSLTLQPGDVIQPYTVVKQIGSGSSGGGGSGGGSGSVVFKAHDTLLDRDVAIKQILPPIDGDAEAFAERFSREAELHKKAAAADPARLLQPIDARQTDRGGLLITELVEGVSLEYILATETGPMPIAQALGIIAAVAVGLSAIHKQDLLHRDLKPANVLLPRAGGLKLADFGLAAAMADQGTMDAGTVRYMAPELLRGDTADARADLYSLGVIAYEMIAGRDKFDEAFRAIVRDQRNPAMRWMKWHTNPRTTAPPLAELVPGTPQPVSDLVARLMEKDPAKRVPDAQALLGVIKRYRSGETPAPGSAAPGSPPPGSPDSPATPATPTQPAATEPAAPAADVAAPTPPAPPAGSTTSPGDTAPLPGSGGVSTMTKLLAAAVVLLLLALGAVGYFAVFANQNQQREKQAYAVFDRARAAMDDGEDQRAKTLFQGLADRWAKGTHLGDAARAGTLLADGRLALQAGDYDHAVDLLQQYDKSGFGDRDTTLRLIEEARQQRDFHQALDTITRDIDQQNFTQARQRIRNWHELTLTEPEQQQLSELSNKLEDQQARAQVDQVLQETDQLLADEDRDQAIQRLRSALAVTPDRRLSDRLNQLQSQAKRDQAFAAAQQAESDGDLDAAIAAMKQAQAAVPDPATADRLARLQSDKALQQGLALLDQNQAQAAEVALTRSINFRDNSQARDALKRIESTSQKAAFIAAGDEALAGGDYDSAVHAYENALAIAPDDHAQAQLTEARTQRSVKRGLNALAEHDAKAAEKNLAEARRLAPNHPALREAMQELQTLRRYQTLLEAGDAARNRSDFGSAKANYRKARDVLDTAAIRERLSQTEYDHLVAQARSYINAEQYNSAQSMLRVALDIHNSKEVRDLLGQVSEKMKKK